MNDALAIDEAPTEKLTTPGLEALLRQKYQRDRYALFFDVPDACGYDQKRRIDAVAIGIWQSVGRQVEAFELKVSRSDWLRELKQVDKADPFIAVCDKFWLVTSEPSVAKLEEIPACWGWMTATKTGLRVQRPAQKLPRDKDTMPWDFVVGLMRKLQDDLINSADTQAEIARLVKIRTDRQDDELKWAEQRGKRNLEELKEAVDAFEKESGLSIRNRWQMGNVGLVVKQLTQLGYGSGLSEVPKLLEGHENALRITLKHVEEARAGLAALPAIPTDGEGA